MATKEQIKKTILEVAGNPESGVVVEFADKWADAIVAIDNPVKEIKEVRVAKPEEVR